MGAHSASFPPHIFKHTKRIHIHTVSTAMSTDTPVTADQLPVGRIAFSTLATASYTASRWQVVAHNTGASLRYEVTDTNTRRPHTTVITDGSTSCTAPRNTCAASDEQCIHATIADDAVQISPSTDCTCSHPSYTATRPSSANANVGGFYCVHCSELLLSKNP